jgi:hypothetical protein
VGHVVQHSKYAIAAEDENELPELSTYTVVTLKNLMLAEESMVGMLSLEMLAAID